LAARKLKKPNRKKPLLKHRLLTKLQKLANKLKMLRKTSSNKQLTKVSTLARKSLVCN